jgi:hypothetical protein
VICSRKHEIGFFEDTAKLAVFVDYDGMGEAMGWAYFHDRFCESGRVHLVGEERFEDGKAGHSA